MDHDGLLALVRRIVLAGGPLFLGSCSGPVGTCPAEQNVTTPVAALLGDASLPDGGLSDGSDDAGDDGGLQALCRESIPPYGGPQPYFIDQCELVTVDGGLAVHVAYRPACLGGRRPEGLAAFADDCSSSGLGDWLARSAYFEAASVDAFLVLAAELDAHRAPGALVEAARFSAQDERRHARVMGALARGSKSRPPVARVTRQPPRTLETIARENAVEGCVRETFAALAACRQASAARDPSIRRAMGRIAKDEVSHAALSWAVHGWSSGMLNPAARRRVRDAQREATETLMLEVTVPTPLDLRDRVGLPDADESASLVSTLLASMP